MESLVYKTLESLRFHGRAAARDDQGIVIVKPRDLAITIPGLKAVGRQHKIVTFS